MSVFADQFGTYAAGSTIGASIVNTASYTAAPGNFPGKRFVGDLNIPTQLNTRYLPAQTEFDWARHRRKDDGGTRRTEARGRSNIGFADGHVASVRPDDLAERSTGKSKFAVLWSPGDYEVQRNQFP